MLLSLKQRSFIIITICLLFLIGMGFVNAYEYKKQNDEINHEPVPNEKSKACIECHSGKGISLGAIREWKLSKHAEIGVGCTNCHGEEPDYVHEVKGAVVAAKCASCHRDEYLQYKGSKHSLAWTKMQKSEMYKSTPDSMKETMCASCHNVGWVRLIPKAINAVSEISEEDTRKCHGISRVDRAVLSKFKSDVLYMLGLSNGSSKVEDKAEGEDSKEEEDFSDDEFFDDDDDFFGDSEETEIDKYAVLDPNSKDVSVGKCDLCHTRHRFSLKEARSPQACINCHLGHNSLMGTSGDYSNSKHGVIYEVEVEDASKEHTCRNCHPGHINYYSTDTAKRGRTPTCSTCHMSKGHDISNGITIGGIGTGGIIEGQKKLPFNTYTLSQLQFDKARISMTILCQDCHTSQFGIRKLKQADKVKRECDKVLAEAVTIVKKLNNDHLINASEAGEYKQPWEFNTSSVRSDMSKAERILIELYASYISTWKSAYHMNDQNNQMQGWSTLNRKLGELRNEEKRLRKKG